MSEAYGPLDARKQLAGSERFHEVVVGFGAQTFDARLFACARGKENEWQCAVHMLSNMSQDLEAILYWHHDVKEREVIALFGKGLPLVSPACGGRYMETINGERQTPSS